MRALVIAIVLTGTACVQSGVDDPVGLPDVDPQFFRCNVQPVLAARCSFMDCHGNAERPLSLYAEQRYRLGIDWVDFETPLTGEELAANFDTVRSFIARGANEPQLLSEKPLDTRAGGLYHQGKGDYGPDDVFLSTDDPGYVLLREFIAGASAADTCEPTEDIGL